MRDIGALKYYSCYYLSTVIIIGQTYSRGLIIYNKCKIASLTFDLDVENKTTFFQLKMYVINTPKSFIYNGFMYYYAGFTCILKFMTPQGLNCPTNLYELSTDGMSIDIDTN